MSASLSPAPWDGPRVSPAGETRAHRLPRALRLASTAFRAVLVPTYGWSYGPTHLALRAVMPAAIRR